jgi:hypothetical protein
VAILERTIKGTNYGKVASMKEQGCDDFGIIKDMGWKFWYGDSKGT